MQGNDMRHGSLIRTVRRGLPARPLTDTVS